MIPRGDEADHDGVGDDARGPAADPAVGSLTVAAHLREWLAVQATQVATSTWYGYRDAIERYLVPALGDRPLGAVHALALNGVYQQLLVGGGQDGRPLSVSTVQGCHWLLRKAFADAVDAGLIEANPCARATPPRRHPTLANGGRHETKVWSIEQLRAFLDLARDDRWYELWVLAAGTGMRRGELLGLSWDDVELDEAILRVRMTLSVVRGRVERKPTKSARPRTISIDDQVVAALARQRDRQAAERASYGPAWQHQWNLVFTQNGGRRLAPDSVTKGFGELVAGLPLPAMTLQGLRHTHASHLLSLKVPIKVVSHRLGHATVRRTMNTYAHLLPGMDQAAVEAFSADLYGDDEADGDVEHGSSVAEDERPGSHEEGENADGSA